ncbi:methyl-accepting chemotaxis protein [Terasakiella pusilla]|jgi:methyl-accepting chemotaxis protein|uniref:methyl-accepting chemotaxis protein n=1 Tax=Terasakiella pusilla TaxID=64973 RepID=UPI00048C2B7B|nr:methyl-accepting chemotaxis protein [Terasakiella pusilla]
MNTQVHPDGTINSKTVRFGIGKRLLSAFGVVGGLSVLVSLIAWNSLSGVMESQRNLTKQNVPAITGVQSLANVTTQLVAAAPLLSNAQNSSERTDRFSEISTLISMAGDQVVELDKLIDDADTVSDLKQQISAFRPLTEALNQNVESRLEAMNKRKALAQSLNVLRKDIKEAVEPYSSSVTDRLIENSDKWYELLEEARAAGVSAPTPDTTDLEVGPIQAVSYHSAVLSYESTANHMVGLLAEGGKSEDLKSLEGIEEQFSASVNMMVEPMGVIAAQSDVAPLTEILRQLMQMGQRGDLQENILKLRRQELELEQTGSELVTQARELSDDLSRTVNRIILTVQDGMDQTIQENESKSSNTLILLVIAGGVAVLIAIGIGWFYVLKNLVSRLLVLEGSMEQIAEGDLQTRINRNGNDEISKMAVALTVLRNGLRETEKLRQSQEEMSRKAEAEKQENAKRLAGEFNASVGQAITILSDNMRDIREQAQSMNQKSQETLSETKEVSDASQIMTQDIALVASSTEELSASIAEISQQVTSSTEVASRAVDRSQVMNGSITRLESSAREIENVINLINSIAEQTNLLALNATIEAARAGEAGKGFAVVASEVKNLANQTSGAIDEIAVLIGDIQKEVSQAVSANGEISEVIEEINQLSAMIAAAVEQQSAATVEISNTVNNAANQVDVITSRIQAVSDDVQMTGQVSEEVLKGVSQMDQQTTTVENDVQVFLKDIRG